MNLARSTRRLFVLGAAAWMAAAFPAPSRAAVHVDASIQVEPAASGHRGDIDVWTNKEEGGVYRQGEPMRVSFRSSADAYVLIYNIDTEGYIHLVYPYGPEDPDRVEGGVTYQVPSRGDPYDLVADGPTGIEYVVAIASPYPFRDLPWYLTGGYEGSRRDEYSDDDEDSGVIVGDPYVGMDRVVRRVVPSDGEDDVATDDTYFYIERKVEYPRYVCADCHSHGGWYDPYGDICAVVDIRIDTGWARFRPLRSRILRPRYFYMVRSTAPTRYRQWKDRWSSIDGRSTLRTRFQVDGGSKFRSRRDVIQGRTPPEFRDVRRLRPGRTWKAPDEVIRRRDGAVVRERERATVRERPGRPETPDRTGWQRQREMRNRDDAQQRQDRDRRLNERRQIQERQQAERRQWRERRPEERPQTRERRDEGRREQARREESRKEESRKEESRKEKAPREERVREPEKRSDDKGDRGRAREERRRDDGNRGGRGRGNDRGR